MDQDQTIKFLEGGALGAEPVQRRTTALSELFLGHEHVYKLKRAVSLPYVDFSTLDARKRTCEREVELNRRTAADLYLGVTAVTRESQGLALDGPGEPVDYMVHMRRFDEATLFHTMADENRLTHRHITLLGDHMAQFHAGLGPLSNFGGRDAMARAVANVVKAAPASIERLSTLAANWRSLLNDCGPRLDTRCRHGLVRQCHGDMHLANICLVEDQPTPFDCIEFNDDLACIDMAYDMAFPVMDLMAHGQPGLANLLLNRYLSITQDYSALPLMPLFIAARALVRASVAAMEDKQAACDTYLDVAEKALAARNARLIAIGGRSGTGKSTLARHLAPETGGPCGAIWLRTDMIRKAILGAKPEERLPEESYISDVTRHTYGRMARTALRALKAGWPVIMDAVFLKPEERQGAERMARLAGAPFKGLWLDAPVDLRAQRVDNRQHDASDADAAIARIQEDIEAGDMAWPEVDVTGTLDENLKAIKTVLEQ